MATPSVARAADDPTGTWKWEVKFNDQSHEVTLKLKLEGDKLTGAMSGRNGDTAIEDGQLQRRRYFLLRHPRTQRQQDDVEILGQAQRRHDQGQNRIRAQRPKPKPRLGSQASERVGSPKLSSHGESNSASGRNESSDRSGPFFRSRKAWRYPGAPRSASCVILSMPKSHRCRAAAARVHACGFAAWQHEPAF